MPARKREGASTLPATYVKRGPSALGWEMAKVVRDIRAACNRVPDVAILIFLPSHRRLGRVQVVVRDNNIDQALKALKKKLQREGVFREMKLRRHYEKPSERRAREAAEAVRRARKVERKRLEREGF